MNHDELCDKIVSVLSRILKEYEEHYEIDYLLHEEAEKLIEEWRRND